MATPDLTATYAVDLKDGTSKTALAAQTALGKLQKSIQADTTALRTMQSALKNLQLATTPNVTLIDSLKKKIEAQKNIVANAQAQYLHLGGSLDGLKKKPRPVGAALDALRGNVDALPGPLGGLLGKFDALKGLLAGGLIPLGIAAVAVALVALTVAAIAATAALLKYGVAQANVRRAELLRLDGLTKMRSWFGFVAGNAKEMQGALDKVAAGSSVGRGKLAEYNAELYKMGLRGANLTAALEATAIKSAAQGEAAAHGFMGWAAGANLAGGSVKKLADNVKARLGGIAQKQMLDLNVQTDKLHESFDALFSGLDIEKYVKALSTITQLFSQNTKSGQALKSIVEHILQPLINAAVAAAPVVKRFFQGIIIGALLVEIAFLTVRNAFRNAFGDTKVLKNLDLTMVALKLGAASIMAIALGFTVLTGVVLLFAAAIAAPFIAAWLLVVTIPEKIYAAFDSVNWSKLGTDLTDGVINGVKNGASRLIGAVKDLGGQAWEAFREKLGIASPSKQFAKLGLALPQGVTAGIEQGAPEARRAAANMVPVPNIAPAKGGESGSKGAAARGRAPVTITFGDLILNGTVDRPTEVLADFKRQLQQALEEVAIAMGAPQGDAT